MTDFVLLHVIVDESDNRLDEPAPVRYQASAIRSYRPMGEQTYVDLFGDEGVVVAEAAWELDALLEPEAAAPRETDREDVPAPH